MTKRSINQHCTVNSGSYSTSDNSLKWQFLKDMELAPKQAYHDFLDEPWQGDFFGAAGRRQPKMA